MDYKPSQVVIVNTCTWRSVYL